MPLMRHALAVGGVTAFGASPLIAMGLGGWSYGVLAAASGLLALSIAVCLTPDAEDE